MDFIATVKDFITSVVNKMNIVPGFIASVGRFMATVRDFMRIAERYMPVIPQCRLCDVGYSRRKVIVYLAITSFFETALPSAVILKK